MFRNILFLGCAVYAQMCSPAHADDWYVGGFVGANFTVDGPLPEEGDIIGIPPTFATPVFEDASITFGGTVGYDSSRKFLGIIEPRFELELSYLSPDIISADGSLVQIEDVLNREGRFFPIPEGAESEASIFFGFISTYADLVFSEDQKIIPYIGAGLGFGVVDLETIVPLPSVLASIAILNDDETTFAWHASAGTTWRATPSIDVFFREDIIKRQT